MNYRVKNWSRFQHYKRRRPPWIKLYRTLLDNFDYQRMSIEGRALAPSVWLLASESGDGSIPADIDVLAFRLRQSRDEIEAGLEALVVAGFLEVVEGGASDLLAERKQSLSTETETEGEGEAETETETTGRVKGKTRVKRFVKPTEDEVTAYLVEKRWQRDFTAAAFCSFYESNGWRVGNHGMKDWKAACRTWHLRRESDNKPRPGQPTPSRVAELPAAMEAKAIKVNVQ